MNKPPEWKMRAPAMIGAKLFTGGLFALAIAAATSIGQAAEAGKGPQAAGRTYAQNYKDMVLAHCLAKAYEASPDAAKDAGSSVSALRDWTYYDMDAATGEIDKLIGEYLRKDYTNPLADSAINGVRFDLLKCMDLYHSPALQAQVDRFVEQPDRTWRQDAGK